MTGEIRIVPFTPAHVDQAAEIERRSFTDPWTRSMFRSELDLGELAWSRAAVAGDRGRLVGYLLAVLIPDEAHLGNIAVDPDFRRRGIAQMLLDDLLGACRAGALRRITLEVRESNQIARNFYCHNGFIDIAIRKNYYRNPVEDAIVMLRSLPEDPR